MTTPSNDSIAAVGSLALFGLWRVTREATAWESIGRDGGTFRIKGGRALYDEVIYNCATSRSNIVTLARLGNYVGTEARGLEQHNRRVDPDTVLEFLEPNDSLVKRVVPAPCPTCLDAGWYWIKLGKTTVSTICETCRGPKENVKCTCGGPDSRHDDDCELKRRGAVSGRYTLPNDQEEPR